MVVMGESFQTSLPEKYGFIWKSNEHLHIVLFPISWSRRCLKTAHKTDLNAVRNQRLGFSVLVCHNQSGYPFNYWVEKARLHRRLLSRQLDAIFVGLKLHQVSNMFETPAISRQQIALKIAPGLHMRFWSCNFRATKIALSCCDKNRLCKRTFTHHCTPLYKLLSGHNHEITTQWVISFWNIRTGKHKT